MTDTRQLCRVWPVTGIPKGYLKVNSSNAVLLTVKWQLLNYIEYACAPPGFEHYFNKINDASRKTNQWI